MLFFQVKFFLFFSKVLRKFSRRRMTMFNISGSLSKIISLRSKKIRVIQHETDHIIGNVTIIWILKDSLSETGWRSIFLKTLKKFCMCRMTMFNISGSLSKIISLRSKKNWGHTTHQSEDIDENPVHIGKKPGCTRLPFRPL